MSHVDDGELTAYADGAYPANDPAALRISAHLSACDNCRTRLEQAHALRDRTAEILGFATPAVRTAPSFETLEAQISTSPVKPRRHFNYAWAATIMLALGLGWFGRGAWQNPPEMREAAEDVPAASVEQVSEVAATPPSEVPAPAPAPQTRALRDQPRDLAGAARMPANRTDDRAALGGIAGTGAGNAAPTAPPPPASVAAAPAIAEADARLSLREGNYISAAEAERQGLVIPRIPELPIARIVPGDTTIVEQTLPDGKVVRLTVTTVATIAEEGRRETSAPRRARDAAPEMAQVQKSVAATPVVSVTRNNKVITITGALPADSLRALAQKIR